MSSISQKRLLLLFWTLPSLILKSTENFLFIIFYCIWQFKFYLSTFMHVESSLRYKILQSVTDMCFVCLFIFIALFPQFLGQCFGYYRRSIHIFWSTSGVFKKQSKSCAEWWLATSVSRIGQNLQEWNRKYAPQVLDRIQIFFLSL